MLSLKKKKLDSYDSFTVFLRIFLWFWDQKNDTYNHSYSNKKYARKTKDFIEMCSNGYLTN